jgi:hypothetical protein
MTRSVPTLRAGLAIAISLALGALGACSGTSGGSGGPATNSTTSAKGSGSAEPAVPAVSSVVSSDILSREPVANTATVKHILISWRDLSDAFQGHLDPRAEKRSKADAEAEVRAVLKQLQEGADFDAVMKSHSEDTSSAMSSRTFTVTPDSQLVIEFRQLSLRLKPGEWGVCQSDFGFHIIKRFG